MPMLFECNNFNEFFSNEYAEYDKNNWGVYASGRPFPSHSHIIVRINAMLSFPFSSKRDNLFSRTF